MNNLIIRLATPSDAKGIATIHVLTWQCNFKGQVPDSYLDTLSIEKKTETWKEQLEKPEPGVYRFVAEIPGQIVGWCVAGTSRDEEAIQNGVDNKDKYTDVGELHGIYIHPDFMRQGIGTKLMEHALHVLKQDGFKRVTLWHLDTNEGTRTFYEKKGWHNEGKTRVDQRDGFDLHETRYSITI